MKKIFILFGLISILAVSGCSQNPQDISSNASNSNKNDILSQGGDYSKSNEDESNTTSFNEDLNSEYDSGVIDILFTVEKEKYPADVSKITYTITNNSQSNYSFPVRPPRAPTQHPASPQGQQHLSQHTTNWQYREPRQTPQ